MRTLKILLVAAAFLAATPGFAGIHYKSTTRT